MTFTKLADSALARYSLVKIGSDADHVTIAGAGDSAIGVLLNAPAGAEATAQIAALAGVNTCLAGAAITAGQILETQASGLAKPLGSGVAVHTAVGIAIENQATPGQPVQFVGGFFIREI